MTQSKTAALLLMFSLAAALSACGEPKRVVTSIPTPPERLVCEAAGTRPTIPAEYRIDWSRVATVAQARAEHDRYVASIRTREGIIVAYVMQVEGKLFVCSNNMQWRRDFERGLAEEASR